MNDQAGLDAERRLHEECGVFGMFDFDGLSITAYLHCSTGDRRAAVLRSATRRDQRAGY